MSIGPEPIDHREVDWDRVVRAGYLIRQTYRYDYPRPIGRLDHRLVIVPPERFGDQRRVLHRLTSVPQGDLEAGPDEFGNTVLALRFSRVEESIEFQAWIEVERKQPAGAHLLPAHWLVDPRLLQPSDLTQPDERLAAAAWALADRADGGLPLAARINAWLYDTMRYRPGVTGVGTTAAQALEIGAGVCQDYAHVMLAVCRACGLPSRYVSGHLLGQGGTHAWVEVVLPTNDGTGDAIAWPFDPTHASRGGLGYVTIAVGGDYSDVAPTSGTYLSSLMGRLVTRKTVTLTGLESSAV